MKTKVSELTNQLQLESAKVNPEQQKQIEALTKQVKELKAAAQKTVPVKEEPVAKSSNQKQSDESDVEKRLKLEIELLKANHQRKIKELNAKLEAKSKEQPVDKKVTVN